MDRSLNNASKPLDENRVQLFHRINAPRFSKTRGPANGRGFDCGCKSAKSDFIPSGVSNVLGHHLVVALSTLTDAALAAIPGIGPALVAFKHLAFNIAQKAGVDIEEELGKLLAEGVEGALFAQYLRSLPAWVPVERKGNTGPFQNAEKREVEMEVEGPLTRSFQTCRDIPFFQWDRWYNWAFQVSPIDGYGYMLGEGNVHSPGETKDLGDPNMNRSESTDVNMSNRLLGGILTSMECLMDFGSFCKHPTEGTQVTGVMYHPGWPFWPMSGDYFWAVGRWVYNCLHPTSEDKTGTTAGRMPTQLRPLKAFAVARYEGFKFDENEKRVPAVRFLFFASKRGGYLDLKDKGEGEGPTTCGISFNDQEYEFIVDLPDPPASGAMVWPIGHTPVFPANTLVLRPSLLMKLEFAPFGVPKSGAFLADFLQFETALKPKVEVIPPEEPNDPPKQVKITIPLSQVPKGKDAYGVCISLGWFDPDGTLAAKVKKVTLTPGPLRMLDGDKDSGNFRFHFSYNGRWFFAPFNDPGEKKPVSLTGADPRFTQFIPDDSRAKLSAHGMRRHGMGEEMEEDRKGRTVRVGGIFRLGTLGPLLAQGAKVLTDQFGNKIDSEFVKDLLKEAPDLLEGQRVDVEWKKHIDQEGKAVASAVAREMFVERVPLFNNVNEPLSLLEPVRVNSNPILMKNFVEELKKNPRATVKSTPFEFITDVIGEADKLAVRGRGGDADYEMDIQWTVENQ